MVGEEVTARKRDAQEIVQEIHMESVKMENVSAEGIGQGTHVTFFFVSTIAQIMENAIMALVSAMKDI